MPTANLKFRIQNLKFQQGFTLIELLVVISIIAILLAVATVSFTNAQEKGRDNKRKSDLKAVQQSLELYFSQNGRYPSTTSGQITCTYTGFDVTAKSWGLSFSCDPDGGGAGASISFMNPLPKDPAFTASGEIYYYDSSTTTSYKLSAKIENVNDKEYCVSTGSNCVSSGKLPCEPTGSSRSYCVVNP